MYVGYIFHWSRFWGNSLDLDMLLTTCDRLVTQIPSYLDPEIAPTPNYPLIHPPGAIIGPLHQNILSRRTLSLDLLFSWNRHRHYDVKCDVSRTGQPAIISIASRTKTVNARQKSAIRKYVHI